MPLSDLFPLRRGKIEMGVLEESKITPSFFLPVEGKEFDSELIVQFIVEYCATAFSSFSSS